MKINILISLVAKRHFNAAQWDKYVSF